MIRSAIIYELLLLTFAWPLGWLAMLLTVVAFIVGIGVGAAWEDELQDQSASDNDRSGCTQIVGRPQ